MARRFLLDQNFPKPRFDVGALDDRAEYIHLVDVDRRLAEQSTPDWLIYLIAEAKGFDGIVTRDEAQLSQREEAVALNATRLTVITWRQPIEDPIVEWGQLIAYTPKLLRYMQTHPGPIVLRLPAPDISAQNAIGAQALLHKLVPHHQSMPEMRAEALRVIRRGLTEHGRLDLLAMVDDGATGPR